MIQATERIGINFDRLAHEFSLGLGVVHKLSARGCNEMEVRRLVLALAEEVDRCYSTATHKRDALLMEAQKDTRETHAQAMLVVDGETPTTLRQHGDALIEEAMANLALSRIQYAEADELAARRAARETERTTIINRLGGVA